MICIPLGNCRKKRFFFFGKKAVYDRKTAKYPRLKREFVGMEVFVSNSGSFGHKIFMQLSTRSKKGKITDSHDEGPSRDHIHF